MKILIRTNIPGAPVLAEEDGEYVVRKEFGPGYYTDWAIDRDTELAELQAWNAYWGAVDNYVGGKLRRRDEYRQHITDLKNK